MINMQVDLMKVINNMTVEEWRKKNFRKAKYVV